MLRPLHAGAWVVAWVYPLGRLTQRETGVDVSGAHIASGDRGFAPRPDPEDR